jgi:hypothetical protein
VLKKVCSWFTSTPSNFSNTLAYCPRSRTLSHCRTSRWGLGDRGIFRRDRELRDGNRKLQAIPKEDKEKRTVITRIKHNNQPLRHVTPSMCLSCSSCSKASINKRNQMESQGSTPSHLARAATFPPLAHFYAIFPSSYRYVNMNAGSVWFVTNRHFGLLT